MQSNQHRPAAAALCKSPHAMLRMPASIQSALLGTRRQLYLLCCSSADANSSVPGPPARRRRRATSVSQQQQLLQDVRTGLQAKSDASDISSTTLISKQNSRSGSRGKTGSARQHASRSKTAAAGNQVTWFVCRKALLSPVCAVILVFLSCQSYPCVYICCPCLCRIWNWSQPAKPQQPHQPHQPQQQPCSKAQVTTAVCTAAAVPATARACLRLRLACLARMPPSPGWYSQTFMSAQRRCSRRLMC
jgi:hypothetical protein